MEATKQLKNVLALMERVVKSVVNGKQHGSGTTKIDDDVSVSVYYDSDGYAAYEVFGNRARKLDLAGGDRQSDGSIKYIHDDFTAADIIHHVCNFRYDEMPGGKYIKSIAELAEESRVNYNHR